MMNILTLHRLDRDPRAGFSMRQKAALRRLGCRCLDQLELPTEAQVSIVVTAPNGSSVTTQLRQGFGTSIQEKIGDHAADQTRSPDRNTADDQARHETPSPARPSATPSAATAKIEPIRPANRVGRLADTACVAGGSASVRVLNRVEAERGAGR